MTHRAERLFLGVSDATCEIRELIARAAKVESSVLISGESGVGKELVAREIHGSSRRRNGPFVALNCAAIPETLIEAELFGYERGAFTGADRTRRGVFELADGGTLFLDEVGDLSFSAQPKLLRALEAREITRVGGERPRPVDLRILAATNRNLRTMCREQRFRPDLYYRLRVLGIRVPPLRTRRDDIVFFANHFAKTLCEKLGRDFAAIDAEGMEYLTNYHWPGNVRELRGVIERALALTSGVRLERACFELDPVSIPGYTAADLFDQEWQRARRDFEAAFVKRLLLRHDNNVAAAAKEANVSPGALYKMMKRQGLEPGRNVEDDSG